MLTFNRTRRQVVATLVLLLGAVAPTAFVAFWSYRMSRPEHRHEVEEALGRRLGMHVEIRSARHPRPGLDVLEGVVLRAEVGGTSSKLTEVARADRLEVATEGDRIAIKATGLAIVGEGGAGFEALHRLLRSASDADGPRRIDLVAPVVVVSGVEDDAPGWSIGDLAATAEVRPRSTVLSASGRLPGGDGAPRRCEFRLAEGEEAAGPGGLSVVLRTADGPIPARLLDPLCGASSWLGTNALAEGTMTFRRDVADPTAWDLEATGEVRGLDLSRLVSERFPGHDLRGEALLTVETARWGAFPNGGRGWRTVRGRLSAGPGTIGPDLLAALASAMHFRVVPSALDDPNDLLPFGALGLAFQIEEDGQIHLDGTLGGDRPPDAVLAPPEGDPRPVLASAPEGAANVLGLWKAMVLAPDDVLVPATAEAQVFRHLPLPPAGQAPPASVRAN